MSPVIQPSSALSKESVTKLFTQYGVQSVPICLFDTPSVTDIFTGPVVKRTTEDAPKETAVFNKSPWFIKPELIRYIPPKPIIVQKPIPQTDSGGGTIVQPNIV
jgi:hypothetical protein